VHRNTDALSCAEAAGVTSEPVRAGRAVVKEVGVNVNEHPALPLLLLLELGRQSGGDIVYVIDIIDGGFTR
jgi:hypothetical protein